MTNNEIISRWMGKKRGCPVAWRPGAIAILTNGEVEVAYERGANQGWEPWQPDTNIALWFGPGGLLQKIEEKGLMQRFADQLTVALGLMIEVEFNGSEWLAVEYLPALIKATPAQLTAALVATITGAGGLTDSEGG